MGTKLKTTTVWRKRAGSDTWHFMQTCRWWPTGLNAIFAGVTRKPRHGEFCNECLAKARRAT